MATPGEHTTVQARNPSIWLQPVAKLTKASLFFGDLIDQFMTTQLYVHAR
jgi:hypothetical protein